MNRPPMSHSATYRLPSASTARPWGLLNLPVSKSLVGTVSPAWFFLLGGEEEKPKTAQTTGEKGAEIPLVGPMISLKTFIVNLADPGGRRYLKVKLDLELTNREVEKELKARLPEVRDQIILALSSKTYQQIQGVAGKTVLREELTARTNAVLKLGKVKKTFFTEFVVQ